MVLHRAVSSPFSGPLKALYTFLPWQTCSFQHRYSFDRGVVKRTKMPKLRNGSKGDSNPGSLDCIIPLYTILSHLVHDIAKLLSLNQSICLPHLQLMSLLRLILSSFLALIIPLMSLI